MFTIFKQILANLRSVCFNYLDTISGLFEALSCCSNVFDEVAFEIIFSFQHSLVASLNAILLLCTDVCTLQDVTKNGTGVPGLCYTPGSSG